MAAVGFSLSKIALEKKAAIPKIDIKSKIFIKEITKDKLVLAKDKDVLNITFEFSLEYSPKLAAMDFLGNLLYLVDSSKTESIIKEFKKTGKLDKEMQVQVYNIIFQRCNIKALQMGPELGLPAHIRLPMISINEKGSEKK